MVHNAKSAKSQKSVFPQFPPVISFSLHTFIAPALPVSSSASFFLSLSLSFPDVSA